MASVYDLKPKFQGLLRPVTRLSAKVGISANAVTIAAGLLSLAVGGVIACFPQEPRVLLLLPIVLFVRMALNAIDGMLAREHNMKSHLGAILNELGDVISDAALYLPLALVSGFSPWLMVTFIVLAIISEMTGVIGVQIGASRRYDGPMGKSDRALVLGSLGLLLGLGVSSGPWLTWVQGTLVAAVVLTIVNRARRALKELQ